MLMGPSNAPGMAFLDCSCNLSNGVFYRTATTCGTNGPFSDSNATDALSATSRGTSRNFVGNLAFFDGITFSSLRIRVFLLHAQSFGFFINIGRFTNSVLTPEDDTLPPAPALLSSVLLWGVHLSGSQFAQYETFCLAQAVALTAQALSTPHPHGVIQYIQSEVLLAHYFFRHNRMIEGKYHTGAAMSLVFSAGFHKIRSVDPSPSPPSLNTMILAPASDLVEEGERINAFWTVVILNSCWSTRESNILYEIVDTPWPLDMQQYSQVRLFVHAAATWFSCATQRSTVLLILERPAQSSIFWPTNRRMIAAATDPLLRSIAKLLSSMNVLRISEFSIVTVSGSVAMMCAQER